ncbi:UNVERIFIED_CONTAM: hypothetical protein Slati_4560800 [Sesamum latifolium]|uniref:Uncharacterized protein n=1 Tax=Sesamum latifolium TaxID=2727402 RepID=A0AAW2S1U4_9LAMI
MRRQSTPTVHVFVPKSLPPHQADLRPRPQPDPRPRQQRSRDLSRTREPATRAQQPVPRPSQQPELALIASSMRTPAPLRPHGATRLSGLAVRNEESKGKEVVVVQHTG